MPTPLAAELKARIRKSGPLSVAAFMQACLYHPQHGYYTRGLNFSTNPPRDFLTAPDHTPLFGATIANWLAATWVGLGSPPLFTLVETGPGRGSLMESLLVHLQSTHGACYAAAQPVLVESSPALTQIQKQTLAAFPQCKWAAKVAPANTPLILIANEFLDSFPINQHIHIGGQLFEVLVGTSAEGQLCFTTAANPSPMPLPPGWQPADGATLETAPDEAEFLRFLKAHAKAALLIDYGANTRATQDGNTLQAINNHTPVHPLHLPGETDLTAHINFASLITQLGEANCTLSDLAPFLLANGLPELGLQHPDQQPRLQRLLHPAQMGTLFKVLCFTQNTR